VPLNLLLGLLECRIAAGIHTVREEHDEGPAPLIIPRRPRDGLHDGGEYVGLCLGVELVDGGKELFVLL